MNSNLPPDFPLGAPEDPDPDDLLAMAYVDGELSPDQLRTFQGRLKTEPALADRVAEMRGLTLVPSEWIPPEPEDREWRKLARDPLQRGGLRLGWFFCLVAVVGLAVAATVSVAQSSEHWAMKVFLLSGAIGAGLLLLLTLRERLAVLPLDPYRKLER